MPTADTKEHDPFWDQLIASMGDPERAGFARAALDLRNEAVRVRRELSSARKKVLDSEDTILRANARILQLEGDLNHANKVAREWEGQARDWDDLLIKQRNINVGISSALDQESAEHAETKKKLRATRTLLFGWIALQAVVVWLEFLWLLP